MDRRKNLGPESADLLLKMYGEGYHLLVSRISMAV